jgi:hypothetical protein
MAEAAWTGLGSSQISRFESESFDSLTDVLRSDHSPSSVGNEPDQYSFHLDAQTYTAIWKVFLFLFVSLMSYTFCN